MRVLYNQYLLPASFPAIAVKNLQENLATFTI